MTSTALPRHGIVTPKIRAMGVHDLPAVARLHREHFPTNIASRFGRHFAERYLAVFLTSPECACLVVSVGHRVDGYLVGVLRTDRHRAHVRRELPRLVVAALPGALLHPRLVVQVVFRRVKTRLAEGRGRDGRPEAPDGPLAVLSHVALRESARGNGHGGLLVEAFEEQAALAGARAALLATLDADDHIGGFYEGRGWRLHDRVVTADGRPLRIYCTSNLSHVE